MGTDTEKKSGWNKIPRVWQNVIIVAGFVAAFALIIGMVVAFGG